MGWSLGYDPKWERDIGYGVPAMCDHPGCEKEIDRGLAYVCGAEPYGGDDGCGLFFCSEHLFVGGHCGQLCERCMDGREPFDPKPDIEKWTQWKMTDPSWEQWRKDQERRITSAQDVRHTSDGPNRSTKP